MRLFKEDEADRSLGSPAAGINVFMLSFFCRQSVGSFVVKGRDGRLILALSLTRLIFS